MTSTLTEAQIEKAVDRAVMRRLATDSAYLNAANAEEQADREQEITDEEVARLTPAECEGHPAGPHDPMGQTVYCDGSCA
jgi:hypothetical protein